MGSISGRVVFADGEPFPGAELFPNGAAVGHEKTGDTGEYRFGNLPPGDYRIVVNPPNFANCDYLPNRGARLYVDRTAGLDSPPIHVAAGQQVNAPEIVMVEAIPHQVTGRIVWDHYPLPGGWQVSTGGHLVPPKNSDGTFAICGLAAGDYTIRTSARIDGRAVAGELKVRIEDEDLKDLEIVPEESAIIRARIEVEDHAPLDLANASVFTIDNRIFPHDSVPQPRLQPDGTFLIDEVYSGEYRFVLGPLPSGSYVKSARINGQDVIDAPILVHGGENLDGLVFTVSPHAARLAGVVQDETGMPVPNAHVFMLPDPKHIDVDIHSCLKDTDQNGGFECDSLTPGKYRIAAWRAIPELPGAWDEVSAKGTPVELPESGRVSIILSAPK
jgi:Carboxypeptidase regulatory-like domain